jgi:hypothetical protein
MRGEASPPHLNCDYAAILESAPVELWSVERQEWREENKEFRFSSFILPTCAIILTLIGRLEEMTVCSKTF